MFQWFINFRMNLSTLKALKKCIRTYERLSIQAMREGNRKLEVFFTEAMKDTVNDYKALKLNTLGALSYIF